VTAPELLPRAPLPYPTGKCKKKEDGKVLLYVLVDEKGQPRNLMFLHPLGTDLDKFALQIAAADRFNPGTHDGVPVVVGESLEVDMQSCVVEKKDDAGKKTPWLQLRSEPVQKFGILSQPPEEAVLTPIGLSFEDSYKAAAPYYRVGGDVSAPVLINSVDPEFTDEARRAKHGGVCIISLIVDVYGRPQHVHVVRALGMGLDQKAIEAVNHFRYKPAMKDGQPVPVMVNVEENFRIY
jgi:TonB family protein